MRAQILNALFERMAVDDRVYFLTGDMGINLVERFQAAYPRRFTNVGIAEQDLIGVSAGLAKVGFRPFAYTISNFLVHRGYEQIRNDVVLHDAPVTLLGTSAGFDNAPLGPTHHVIDELGALRALHGIDIYTPSSLQYAATIIERVLGTGRPSYVRMPKAETAEPASADDLVYLRSERCRILLVTHGSAVKSCWAVHQRRNDVSLLVVNRLRPLDRARVSDALREHERAYAVEDQTVGNGVHAEIALAVAAGGISIPVGFIGPTGYSLTVGSTSAFYERMYGFDPAGIEATIAA